MVFSVALAHTATARTSSCKVPGNLPVPVIRPPDGKAEPRQAIDGYILALSWSPEFCRLRRDDLEHRGQCGTDADYGFVLHGLWPEGRGRSDPAWCATREKVPEMVARRHYCQTPSAWLMAHEWAKHGACMANFPRTYFGVAGVLFESLQWPDMNALSRSRPDWGKVLAAIARANPEFPAKSFALDVNRRGWLEEIFVCYDTKFLPKACDRQSGLGQRGQVKIWRGR